MKIVHCENSQFHVVTGYILCWATSFDVATICLSVPYVPGAKCSVCII